MADSISEYEGTLVGEGDSTSKGLKTGALGLVSVTVIGVASTAPGYSLAAGIGGIAGEVGNKVPLIMIIAFIPMFFIAKAYEKLNRADPDCGTIFTWMTRTIGPRSGFLTGWGVIIADLLIMPNLAGISGSYLFKLFGAHGLAESTYWTVLLGAIFIAAMTYVCVVGIELNAKMQVAFLATEIVVLLVFAVTALYRVYTEEIKGSVKPSLSWFNPFDGNLTMSAAVAGILVAVFAYWGWDTAVAVNEETKDSNKTPGRAAILSTLILLATYVFVSMGAQAFGGAAQLAKNGEADFNGDAFSAVGEAVFGSSTIGRIMEGLLIISILSSAAASCQTTILPASRSMLSMGSHGALPKRFGSINLRRFTPAYSTIVFGVVSIVWYLLGVAVEDLTDGSVQMYGASIAAVGLCIAFYHGLTGLTCVLYFGKKGFSSIKNFISVFLFPLLGFLAFAGIFFKTIYDEATMGRTALDNDSYGQVGGVSTLLIVGLSLLLLGIPIMFFNQVKSPTFFNRKRDPKDQRPNPDGSGPRPPHLSAAGVVEDI